LKATVIIPTFEDWTGLQACLDCLARQSAAEDLFEIVVANNNPSPEIPASLRLPANARVIHAVTPGSYAARRAVLRAARGEVLFFTDSDCFPDSRWIEAGLAEIDRLGPHGRVAGGIEMFPRGATWTGPELFDRVRGLRQSDYVKLGWCVTANLVVKKAAFDLVGPFSEDRFSGGDGEWNRRATALGCELVYCPDVLVRHPARASFAELAKKRRRWLGGQHQAEASGKQHVRSLAWYLTYFIQMEQLQRVVAFPGLTGSQRFQVIWLGIRLGFVCLIEMARLRHFSGEPRRS
jgi:GT2 family glycosyltransferase